MGDTFGPFTFKGIINPGFGGSEIAIIEYNESDYYIILVRPFLKGTYNIKAFQNTTMPFSIVYVSYSPPQLWINWGS